LAGGCGDTFCLEEEGKGLIISIFRHKIYPDAAGARVAELADALDLGTDQAFFFLFTNLSKSHLKNCFHFTNQNQQSQIESGRISPKESLTGTVWAQ